nr:hypothetical protein CFP56_54794 [Quercus suber]
MLLPTKQHGYATSDYVELCFLLLQSSRLWYSRLGLPLWKSFYSTCRNLSQCRSYYGLFQFFLDVALRTKHLGTPQHIVGPEATWLQSGTEVEHQAYVVWGVASGQRLKSGLRWTWRRGGQWSMGRVTSTHCLRVLYQDEYECVLQWDGF